MSMTVFPFPTAFTNRDYTTLDAAELTPIAFRQLNLNYLRPWRVLVNATLLSIYLQFHAECVGPEVPYASGYR